MATSSVMMFSADCASLLRSARLAWATCWRVVDVVDEAAFDLVHTGIDVTGDGDVDEEHGAVAAALEEVLSVRAVEELLGGSGGGDDDVGTVGLFVESFVWDDGGGDRSVEEFGGELFGTGLGAIGEKDAGGTVLDEMTSGELGHLPLLRRAGRSCLAGCRRSCGRGLRLRRRWRRSLSRSGFRCGPSWLR